MQLFCSSLSSGEMASFPPVIPHKGQGIMLCSTERPGQVLQRLWTLHLHQEGGETAPGTLCSPPVQPRYALGLARL